MNVVNKLRGDITLKKFSDKNKIPYRVMKNSDDISLSEWVKNTDADIMVIYSMSQLLKKHIYDIPKFGAINLHPAMLPDFRGPNPDFWQYYSMELNPGVTVHFLDEGEDTGDIVCQQRVSIYIGEKSQNRLDKMISDTGVKMLLRVLNKIQAGTDMRIKQPLNSSTIRARNLTIDEHKTIINWYDWPIEKIWHILRGTEQWLNALSQPSGIWKGHRWIVEEYQVVDNFNCMPGEIQKDRSRYYVNCLDGRIFLSLKFDFKKMIIGFVDK